MTGRGIDQVLRHPSDPAIHESYLRWATDYVNIAERKNGSISRKVSPEYIWGEALIELERHSPDVRIVNLETTITTSEDWVDKGINYRMHPENTVCLSAAKIDACVLSNNHILDWGEQGLLDTIDNLKCAKIRSVGVGASRRESEAPVCIPLSNGGRVILFAFGSPSSGIPKTWAVGDERPGVNLLENDLEKEVLRIRDQVELVKRSGDVVVFSVHWGENWGYGISESQRAFAHGLIDHAGVDLIHGHSSHHAKGIEVYREKLILYGCGDFITDYEGISGYEEFRGDLAMMYFPTLATVSGELISCELVPLKMHRFQLVRPAPDEVEWLRKTLCREGKKLGTSLSWNGRAFELKSSTSLPS